MYFLELVFADDAKLDVLANEEGVSVEELAQHQADAKEVAKCWAVWMPPSQIEATDPAIWKHIGTTDLPRDTALYTARDIINKHLNNNFHLIAAVSHLGGLEPIEVYDSPLTEYWRHVLYSFEVEEHYRLCAECGKPFSYQNKKATYCSDACRTAASRRRRAEEEGPA